MSWSQALSLPRFPEEKRSVAPGGAAWPGAGAAEPGPAGDARPAAQQCHPGAPELRRAEPAVA